MRPREAFQGPPLFLKPSLSPAAREAVGHFAHPVPHTAAASPPLACLSQTHTLLLPLASLCLEGTLHPSTGFPQWGWSPHPMQGASSGRHPGCPLHLLLPASFPPGPGSGAFHCTPPPVPALPCPHPHAPPSAPHPPLSTHLRPRPPEDICSALSAHTQQLLLPTSPPHAHSPGQWLSSARKDATGWGAAATCLAPVSVQRGVQLLRSARPGWL